MSSLLKKALQNGLKLHIPEKPLKKVTHQSTLHHVEIPVPSGIHSVEQIWHSNMTYKRCHRRTVQHIGHQLLHRGGLWTIRSFVCALGVYLQMTESTINSTFCIFIEQLSNSDMQKMVIQFTPNTVYTLNNKIKHLVHQFNTHSKQSLCIPSQIEYIQ